MSAGDGKPYVVQPLNGTCYVQIIEGARTVTQSVSSTTVLAPV